MDHKQDRADPLTCHQRLPSEEILHYCRTICGSVGKENNQKNNWNNADVHTTDVLTREPVEKKTYAAVVRRNAHCVRFNDRSERMRV
jgi:hypothetical protein